VQYGERPGWPHQSVGVSVRAGSVDRALAQEAKSSRATEKPGPSGALRFLSRVVLFVVHVNPAPLPGRATARGEIPLD
jgi:hypothetical protein